ncbi:LIM domain-containing protein [Loa loa]|uniref:LIM domain-containing protein n=1 Tax=Loa loa TaxID=7209 RepID=A0A1I7VPM9_LOALO|nr:LIM domain-containing protein [Loa loa]EFO17777.1 LIM domain-containing protein [Loa loa]
MVLDAYALTLSNSPLSTSSLSLSLSLPSSEMPIAAENLDRFLNMQSIVDLSRESSTTSPKAQTFNSPNGGDCDDVTVPPAVAGLALCNGCGYEIKEKYMVQVDDNCWHENCLICCSCRIPLSGSTCYSRSGQFYCKEDYIV